MRIDSNHYGWLLFPIMITLSKRAVTRQMHLRGIPSMAQLAEQIGVDPSHLCKLLQGASFTSATLTKIVRVLECNPGDLLKGR